MTEIFIDFIYILQKTTNILLIKYTVIYKL